MLYTRVRALPDMPTQRPSDDCAHAGANSKISVESLVNIPAFATAPSPPGS